LNRAILTTRYVYDRTKLTGHLGGKRYYHGEIWDGTGATIAVRPGIPSIEEAINWAVDLHSVPRPKIWLDGSPIVDEDPVPDDRSESELASEAHTRSSLTRTSLSRTRSWRWIRS
jgi:hypothetical protein